MNPVYGMLTLTIAVGVLLVWLIIQRYFRQR